MADLPTIEGFRILEELGAGSLSTVYEAVEEPLGRTVALKVLKPTIALGSPFASQLEREARVLAELSHPNIGALHAFVKTEARMHLVLEFVDGFSLGTLLKKKPSVPADSVAAIGAAVARGLAHAHERGIVHRDVKPANVLVSKRGEVKIFDFGIAQRASDEPVGLAPTRLEDVTAFGTPAYMSPEQILGENVDARSDIFSLGVVLYQLVCGARPFERGDEPERRPSAHRIRRDPPIPLHRRAPDVPHALERIVMRAIEKLPADRFQSAETMAEQLEELATARSGLRVESLVVQALEHAGLVAVDEAHAAVPPRARRRASVRRAVAGLAVLGAIAVGGGIAVQTTAPREGRAAGARPLELVPASPGYLRVLATPWAEVWVDGQRIDVTPFARGIPLAPGTHYVTLVHPNAPVEKRSVSMIAGETRTLDVVMAVPDLAPKDDAGAAQPSAEREKN
ncbi:MAG TPA: serine/threonine-protein kinase [Polyangiaceae bacterium]|nr:serine/threonine-protein kinase [Polyangiaceae bacterium]